MLAGDHVMTAGLFRAMLLHDRAVVLGSLALVVLLAWIYLVFAADTGMQMKDMGGGQMMAMLPEWTLGYGFVIFVMWAVMMVAMMLPSAAPVTLLVSSVAQKRISCIRRIIPTSRQR
jgi:predicted metal-binding membrane protein